MPDPPPVTTATTPSNDTASRSSTMPPDRTQDLWTDLRSWCAEASTDLGEDPPDAHPRTPGAGGRDAPPPDHRHLRHRGADRPVLDREGVRHGGPEGRLPGPRLRDGQVREPRRARRLRRGIDGQGAVDRPLQPEAGAGRGAHGDGADPLRGPRSAPGGAV